MNQTIRIHSIVDDQTIDHAIDLFRSARKLARRPQNLGYYLYVIGGADSIRRKREQIESEFNVTVNAFDVRTRDRGSLAHSTGVNLALSNITNKIDKLNVIADSDTLIVANHWDVAVRQAAQQKIGIIGTPYEDIGGFTSGNVPVQTYKGIPNLVWCSLLPLTSWNKIDATSRVDKPMSLTPEEAEIFGLPKDKQLLRDAGWQLPRFLHENQLSSLAFSYYHASTPGSVILKPLGWDYHEEYHLCNIPFVVHQRGARKFKFDSKEARRFRARVWEYIDQNLEVIPEWETLLATTQVRMPPQTKAKPSGRVTRAKAETRAEEPSAKIEISDKYVISPNKYVAGHYTSDTDYLLVSCCLEQSRADVLQEVVKNLCQQDIDMNKLTIFDNASTIDTKFLEESFGKERVWRANRNIGYWSAISWWLKHRATSKFTYIIESDLIHYDMHRLFDAEQFLLNNPNVGSVRTLKFEVENRRKYYKSFTSSSSKLPLVSRSNKVTNQDLQFELASEESKIYVSNFLTHLPALNRRATMDIVFDRLTTKHSFDELGFQSAYWSHYTKTALLDGGIMHYDLAPNGGRVVTGSWTDPGRLRKIGYKNSRNGVIEKESSYVVTQQV